MRLFNIPYNLYCFVFTRLHEIMLDKYTWPWTEGEATKVVSCPVWGGSSPFGWMQVNTPCGEQQRRRRSHTVCSPDCLFKTCFKGLCSALPVPKNERPVTVGSRVVWNGQNGHLDLFSCDSFQTTWDRKAVCWQLGLVFLFNGRGTDFSPFFGISRPALLYACFVI